MSGEFIAVFVALVVITIGFLAFFLRKKASVVNETIFSDSVNVIAAGTVIDAVSDNSNDVTI